MIIPILALSAVIWPIQPYRIPDTVKKAVDWQIDEHVT